MKQLQRVIACCSVLGTLLWLTACESEDFLKVESVRSPLMEDFESYASIQEVTAKLPKDLEVKVVADTSPWRKIILNRLIRFIQSASRLTSI